ncbi:MAG: glutathione-disulfide reductase [Oceanicoccus sp.]|uniref:glutathione-disulfide reductase n=1 Tax=Oceanicoccus sp. TaxID=2691044 RepID=UPI00262C9767|nr:glutathione-disulfide reductase [Oceanicoccus sp.]MCP3908998.1 glutathione-disulfide reductase [Oceanicoccus sp.]MDG1771962.1 glutathione-disulfide reductase [Oceanicoccus sp.]
MSTHQYDFDLLIIGAGSGGVRASRMAASFGAKVAVIEDRYMGGTCVNVGCVPKKLYVYASEYRNAFKDAQGFGWSTSAPEFDWPTLRDNKIEEISRLNGVYDTMLGGAGVTVIDGRGRFVDNHTVAVNDQQYTAERIMIATGTWPYIPEFPGSEYAISSNEVFDLEEFPKRMLVVGGGYIAVEFAGIFNGLGAQTTQLYRGPLFLRGFDQDIREFAAKEIAASGIDLRFNSNIATIEKQADGSLTALLEDGSSIVADAILYATGRKPHLQNLGFDNVDVALNDNGTIKIGENFQTSESNIYALGDITGGMELTPVALAEGMAFAKTLYNNEATTVDYDTIPTAVFCQPNIGTCGLSEEAARKKYSDITVYDSEFRAMKHTIGGRAERTYMKLIVDTASDRVVGIHMAGEDAGEIIQGMAVAMKAGATKAIFDNTIGIHPTAAEEFVTMRSPRVK